MLVFLTLERNTYSMQHVLLCSYYSASTLCVVAHNTIRWYILHTFMDSFQAWDTYRHSRLCISILHSSDQHQCNVFSSRYWENIRPTNQTDQINTNALFL